MTASSASCRSNSGAHGEQLPGSYLGGRFRGESRGGVHSANGNRDSVGKEGAPDRGRLALGPYATSTIASISTVMPLGSEPMPTAERAWRLASSKTSTKRSEQPLITW